MVRSTDLLVHGTWLTELARALVHPCLFTSRAALAKDFSADEVEISLLRGERCPRPCPQPATGAIGLSSLCFRPLPSPALCLRTLCTYRPWCYGELRGQGEQEVF
jgi:hypothetical protein